MFRLRVSFAAIAFLMLPLAVSAQSGGSGLPASGAGQRTCSFRCAPRANPAGEGTIGNVVVPCTTDQDCQQACTSRCPIYGPEGNGLSAAAGTGLVCAQNPSPRCVAAPAAPASAPAVRSSGQSATAPIELLDPLGTTDIAQLVGRIAQAIFGILGALALLWFVWGGVLWMTAGESKRTAEAQAIIKNAAVGIIILFFSYGLATAFLGIFESAATSSTRGSSVFRESTSSQGESASAPSR